MESALAEAISRVEGVDFFTLDEAGLVEFKWRAGTLFTPRDILMEQAREQLNEVQLDRPARPEAALQTAAAAAGTLFAASEWERWGGLPGPSIEIVRAAPSDSLFVLCDNCTDENRAKIEKYLRENSLPRTDILKALNHGLRCNALKASLWPEAKDTRAVERKHVANIRKLMRMYPAEAAQWLRGNYRQEEGVRRHKYTTQILAVMGADAFEPLFHSYWKVSQYGEEEEKERLSSVLAKVMRTMFRSSPSRHTPPTIKKWWWLALDELFKENAEMLLEPAARFLVRAEKQGVAEEWIEALFEDLDPEWKIEIAKKVFEYDPDSSVIQPLFSTSCVFISSYLEEAVEEGGIETWIPLLKSLVGQRASNRREAVLGDYEAQEVLKLMEKAFREEPRGGETHRKLGLLILKLLDTIPG